MSENISGIFEDKYGNYYWMNGLDEYEVREAKYFMFENCAGGHHVSHKSALYDDLTGYVDELQHEDEFLSDTELYVVTYFEFDDDDSYGVSSWGLNQVVDFCVTKQEIIDNVKAQKYVEGASYFTMGHMFYATRIMMEEMKNGNIDFDYYEIEFGILADGAQTGDYETQANSMCIKAKKWPRLDEAAEWLAEDMKLFDCDCVHSVTRITEKEALAHYGFDGTEPIFG